MDENKSRRRWLSFGIRDLFWAMVVVGLGLSLYFERSKSVRLEHKLSSLRTFTRNHGFDINEFEKDGMWSIADSEK
jgi:hypothetical protein